MWPFSRKPSKHQVEHIGIGQALANINQDVSTLRGLMITRLAEVGIRSQRELLETRTALENKARQEALETGEAIAALEQKLESKQETSEQVLMSAIAGTRRELLKTLEDHTHPPHSHDDLTISIDHIKEQQVALNLAALRILVKHSDTLLEHTLVLRGQGDQPQPEPLLNGTALCPSCNHEYDLQEDCHAGSATTLSIRCSECRCSFDVDSRGVHIRCSVCGSLGSQYEHEMQHSHRE